MAEFYLEACDVMRVSLASSVDVRRGALDYELAGQCWPHRV
jgi:hypothetical protein